MNIRWQVVVGFAVGALSAGFLTYFAGATFFYYVSFGSYENSDFIHMATYTPGILFYILFSTIVPILIAWAGVYTIWRSSTGWGVVGGLIGATVAPWGWFLANTFFIALISL